MAYNLTSGSAEGMPSKFVVQDVIDELNSASGRPYSGTGRFKNFYSMTVEKIKTDVARNAAWGAIALHSDYEGLHVDEYCEKKTFVVSLADLERLAERAPKFRREFGQAAQAFATQLGFERAVQTDTVKSWRDAELKKIFAETSQSLNVLRQTTLMNMRGNTTAIFGDAIKKIALLPYPGKKPPQP